MLADITTALSSIKAVSEFASLVLKTKVDAAVREKAIELQSELISLQSTLLSLQAQYQDLLRENERLKQEQVAMKNWEAEAQKYHLAEFASGVFAYTLNQDQLGTQPSHWLCGNCYEKNQKSILQKGPKTIHGYIISCANCNDKLTCFPKA